MRFIKYHKINTKPKQLSVESVWHAIKDENDYIKEMNKLVAQRIVLEELGESTKEINKRIESVKKRYKEAKCKSKEELEFKVRNNLQKNTEKRNKEKVNNK